MVSNVQEFAQSASDYKELTLDKNLKKKRGRSCVRREKRHSSIDSRIMRDRLASSFAYREFRKEMKQFEKTKTEAAQRGIYDIPEPEFLGILRESSNLADANLKSANVSKAAMDQFPPLT